MFDDLVWVEAKCLDYYKIIKKLKLINIKVYEIKYIDKILYLKIERNDLKKLNKYLVSYKFRIKDELGLAKIKNIIRKNWIIFFSSIFGLALLIILQNMIIKINVVHENLAVRELIKDELDSYGIKVLHFKKNYAALDKIRQEILDKYPDQLDWMEFEVKGMVVNVKVEERIITNIKKDAKTCDLIATKNGVVSDIKVTDGEVNVMINDYVRKGDILVKGIVNYNEEDRRYTCAKGEIFATTWYTVSVSMPFDYDEYEKSGRRQFNIVYENGGIKKNILRSKYKYYQSNLKNILKFGDFNLYVDTQEEVKKVQKKYSQEDVIEAGILKASENIEKKIGKNSKIIDKKVLKKKTNNSTMDIDVFVVVQELISTEQEIQVEKGFD